jgi:hypothetical protein
MINADEITTAINKTGNCSEKATTKQYTVATTIRIRGSSLWMMDSPVANGSEIIWQGRFSILSDRGWKAAPTRSICGGSGFPAAMSNYIG